LAPANLAEASKDLRYLLSRGYRREGAVRFVGDKYGLRQIERLVLYRCVYDTDAAGRHKTKLARVGDIVGRSLSVDGYNVLITTENLLSGVLVIMSDDGLLRDVASVSGRYRISAWTGEALKILLSVIKDAKPSRTLWFFDAPIPRSGELSSIVRQELRSSGLEGDAATVRAADRAAVLTGELVASSDSAAVEKAAKVIDLPRQVAADRGMILPRVEDLDDTALLRASDEGLRRE